MDLANLKLDCLGDRPDVRDFSLIEAVERLNREGNQQFKYVLFDIGKYESFLAQVNELGEIVTDQSGEISEANAISESEEYEILNGNDPRSKKRLFRKFEVIDPSKNPDFYTTPSSVLIPLRQSYLRIESKKFNGTEGLVLIGKNDTIEGEIGIEDNRIKLFRIDKIGNKREVSGGLVINEFGQVSIIGESIKTLYLGEGFRSYSIDRVGEASFFPEVEDQGSGGLCAACAGVGILEYFERKIYGKHLDASKLFLHQVACKLMNVDPNKGVSVRSVVAAMKVFGVPPEHYWPYNLEQLMVDPPADCYAYARGYRALSYLRLDRFGMTQEALIAQIKVMIYSDIPVICSFSVHNSVQISGDIPYPNNNEVYLGTHAVVLVGYDDNKEIKNPNKLPKINKGSCRRMDNLIKSWEDSLKSPKHTWPNSYFTSKYSFLTSNAYIQGEYLYTKGAFRIRNSWGSRWGDNGYGWLPYAYVYQGLASDFWTILKVDLGEVLSLSADNPLKICQYPCSS